MKIVLCTGGFDPLHSGHIEYFKAAKQLGDRLIVGLNSDAWLTQKKGRSFMPIWERNAVVSSLKMVDQTVMVADDPDGSCSTFIKETLDLFPDATVVFANGGDRTHLNIPEMAIETPRLSFAFGVGGFDKSNSSRWILEEWKAPKTERSWGYYRVLHEVPGMKVKELTINPNQRLSMQRHQHRKEYWIVSEGVATIGWGPGSSKLRRHKSETIGTDEWHQLANETDQPLKIVEIQYGTACDESDIERKPQI